MLQLRSSRFVSVLLALSLALSPLLLLPRTHNDGAPANAQHAISGHMNTEHGMQSSAKGVHDQTACDSHAACGGKCCSACAHCVTDVTVISPQLAPHQPIQSSLVTVLRIANRPSVQDRPPQA